MERFFAFLGRCAERLISKKFFITGLYLALEAYCRLHGIPFSWETIAPVLTYIGGQSIVDLKSGKEKPSPASNLIPIIAAGAVACMITSASAFGK